MTFKNEAEFENKLIGVLTKHGWESDIIKYPTENDLLENWAKILYENNRSVDRLGDFPLTESEMQQIIERIKTLKSPLKLNGFINGKTISITRDNPDDKLHFGKEISLKIYDRQEIAAGQSRYQIVKQPKFKPLEKMLPERRGDLMLLINGMPVIHIELKRSGVHVSQACNQIQKYSKEGVFTGLFSLIQIFVAMNPDETLYFANPGHYDKFNKDYYFHWADFNNEPINDWSQIASSLLSIPMAHELIGYYTVADDADGILKVMRSYQFYASSKISDKVKNTKWDSENQLGGYIWHTTGSGKTMTSFKSAQLIANSKDADKVVFLMDRIELCVQSLKEYRAFADECDEVQETENTNELVSKLKSDDTKDTLIVTSIQKMSNITQDMQGLKAHDLETIQSKRIVFIIDECHRDTFGEMLITIKQTFPKAIFFGFTGTPIMDENSKKDLTNAAVFGDELHRYSIADGIRDGNVLGFDPDKIMTYKDKDLRKIVALEQAKCKTEEEAIADPKKSEIYYEFMNNVPMAGDYDKAGKYKKGIEDYIPTVQYQTDIHQDNVIKDILDNWTRLSHGGKFHAIFATSGIPEAIEYYRKFRKLKPELKITALFDPSIDNESYFALDKEDGIVEMLKDYNDMYGTTFTIPTYDLFKKDVSARLAHKKPYLGIHKEPEKQLHMLIVVNQMLTGFDSKWVNTLYMDKLMEYADIIQAFSRTNRLFGNEKPFGNIRYYRKPHTMERNINRAVKLYSGDKPIGLFVNKIVYNVAKMNEIFRDISDLFNNAGVPNFDKLPEEKPVRGKFASLFKKLTEHLEAARIQGFVWNKTTYTNKKDNGKIEIVEINFTEKDYLILAQRYKELPRGGNGGAGDVPYEIDGYLTEIDTGVIDANYMNSRFEKYLRNLKQENISPEELESTKQELHKSFATLSQEEQKYAKSFLLDIESGAATMEEGKTFKDYVNEYMSNAKNDRIHKMATALGLDESKLRGMMDAGLNESNLNSYGRFNDLKQSINIDIAKEFFKKSEGKELSPLMINVKANELLKRFILDGGFDIE